MFAKLYRPFAWWTVGLITASAVLAVSSNRTDLPQTVQLAANHPDKPRPSVTPVHADAEKTHNPRVAPGKVHWHASFDDAKLAAERSGKPIFRFQMLGSLDRQYCCSNSRIARDVLFSSAEIAEYIDASFEPVWESVRPVPLVTIDFGNDHVLRRSLHGNIATYLCSPGGVVYDILPGIYSPSLYRSQLEAFKALADSAKSQPAGSLAKFLSEYHTQKAALPSAAAPTPQMQAIAQTGGGGKFGGGGIPQGIGGGFQGTGFGGGGFKGGTILPATAVPKFGGIEGPTESVLMGQPAMPTNVPQVPLADRPELVLDSQVNEQIRRRAIHERLAASGNVRPEELKKWLFKEVLRVDLDDPLLGLGPVLTANYPFDDGVPSAERK